ncbi:hypothetical protein [Streptosporangium jomthongense]
MSNIYQWGVMGASAKNVAELTGLLWADWAHRKGKCPLISAVFM